MSAIDKSRFVAVVADEFYCPICLNIFNLDAVEDDKGHDFCTDCIHTWLKTRKCCPLDNCHLDETKLRPIGFGFKGLLGKLEVRCKYVNIGCNEICKLEILDNHERNCTYKILKCKNCRLTVKIDELNSHQCIESLLSQNCLLKTENKKLKNELVNYKAEIERLKKRTNTISEYAQKTENSTSDYISRQISSIGSEIIFYAEDLSIPYEECRFAINNQGFVAILCYGYGLSKVILYNSNHEFVISTMLPNLPLETCYIAVTDDLILLGYTDQDTVKLDSYNFSLKKLNSFMCVLQDLYCMFPIDTVTSDNQIYLKAQCKLSDSKYTHTIFVLNKCLNEVYSFDSDRSILLHNILIRNDTIVYFSSESNEHLFQIKSIKNRSDIYDLQMFILEFESDIRCVLGPNENLFVLVLNEYSRMNEYSLDGNCMRSVKLQMLSLNFENCIFRLTDNYTFIIGETINGECLFLSKKKIINPEEDTIAQLWNIGLAQDTSEIHGFLG